MSEIKLVEHSAFLKSVIVWVDSTEFIQRESFWLLYDDEEVGDPDAE